MTLWDYKDDKNDYRKEYLYHLKYIEKEGWSPLGVLATVSDHFNGHIDVHEKDYEALLSNLAHLITLGAIHNEFYKLRTKDQLQLKNYQFNPDDIHIEEYLAIHLTRKTLNDAALCHLPDGREELIADAQTVMDAIGLEIK